MKLTAVTTLVAVLFLSVHVAVDHCAIQSGMARGVGEADSVCGHTHDEEHEADSQADRHEAPTERCEDSHIAAFMRSALVKISGLDGVACPGLAVNNSVSAQILHLDLSLCRCGPILKPPVLLLKQSFLI